MSGEVLEMSQVNPTQDCEEKEDTGSTKQSSVHLQKSNSYPEDQLRIFSNPLSCDQNSDYSFHQQPTFQTNVPTSISADAAPFTPSILKQKGKNTQTNSDLEILHQPEVRKRQDLERQDLFHQTSEVLTSELQQLSLNDSIPLTSFSYSSHSLFISNVSSSSDEMLLNDLFSKFGELYNLQLNCGCVLVCYDDIRSAQNVYSILLTSTSKLNAFFVHGEFSGVDKAIIACDSIMNDVLNDEMIKQELSQFGEIRQVLTSPSNNKRKFVQFFKISDAAKVLTNAISIDWFHVTDARLYFLEHFNEFGTRDLSTKEFLLFQNVLQNYQEVPSISDKLRSFHANKDLSWSSIFDKQNSDSAEQFPAVKLLEQALTKITDDKQYFSIDGQTSRASSAPVKSVSIYKESDSNQSNPVLYSHVQRVESFDTYELNESLNKDEQKTNNSLTELKLTYDNARIENQRNMEYQKNFSAPLLWTKHIQSPFPEDKAIRSGDSSTPCSDDHLRSQNAKQTSPGSSKAVYLNVVDTTTIQQSQHVPFSKSPKSSYSTNQPSSLTGVPTSTTSITVTAPLHPTLSAGSPLIHQQANAILNTLPLQEPVYQPRHPAHKTHTQRNTQSKQYLQTQSLSQQSLPIQSLPSIPLGTFRSSDSFPLSDMILNSYGRQIPYFGNEGNASNGINSLIFQPNSASATSSSLYNSVPLAMTSPITFTDPISSPFDSSMFSNNAPSFNPYSPYLGLHPFQQQISPSFGSVNLPQSQRLIHPSIFDPANSPLNADRNSGPKTANYAENINNTISGSISVDAEGSSPTLQTRGTFYNVSPSPSISPHFTSYSEFYPKQQAALNEEKKEDTGRTFLSQAVRMGKDPSRDEKIRKKNDERYTIRIEEDGTIKGTRTTLMIKNIPNKYSQKMLLELFDREHKNNYDFFYLPIDFKNNCNVGYAFINMTSVDNIVSLVRQYHDKKWERFNSEKVCDIAYARIQGLTQLIEHFKRSNLLAEDEKYRPVVLINNVLSPFPVGGTLFVRRFGTREVVFHEFR